MSESARQITGDDIISELIRNALTGAFKVRYTVLLPSVFNIYLHPADFEAVRPVADFVKREAARALDEHVSRLNRSRTRPQLLKRIGMGGGQKATYKPLQSGWQIEFHRDLEEHLQPGEIEIYSDFAQEQAAELGAGAKTTFISRKPLATEVEAQQNSEAKVLATLRYRDGAGEKTFFMTRDQIVIGRGGKAVWVDLRLDGPTDVSREHCRIRRDARGDFLIKDLSQYGTAVEGKAVPSSVERRENGDKADRNIEVRLPSPARITLAGVVQLEFEAAQP